MGYFRQKLDRGRARAGKRAAAQQSSLPGERWEWVLANATTFRSSARHRFIRFAVDGKPDNTSGGLPGVFQAAYELRDRIELSRRDKQAISAALTWFEKNLRAPKSVHSRAVFWFKLGAPSLIDNIWPIVRALQLHGRSVKMMIVDQPGVIHYEDELQVAAEPYADKRPLQKLVARSR